MDTSSASHRQSRGIRAGALAQNSSQGWPAFVFYDLGSIVQGRQSQQLKMMLLPCVAFVLAVVSVDGRIGVALNTTNTSADLQFVCLQGQPVCTIHLPTKDQCQQLCASPEPRPPLMVCALRQRGARQCQCLPYAYAYGLPADCSGVPGVSTQAGCGPM